MPIERISIAMILLFRSRPLRCTRSRWFIERRTISLTGYRDNWLFITPGWDLQSATGITEARFEPEIVAPEVL